MPFRSVLVAGAVAIVCLLGAFVATPAQAQTSSRTFSVVHTFDYSLKGEGGNPLGNLVEDSQGDLYGVTEMGGSGSCSLLTSSGCGTVYELVPQAGGGYVEQTLYNFTGGNDGEFPLGGLAMDAAGDLFGTTGTSASGDGTIFEVPYESTNSSYGGLVTLYTFTGVCNSTTCSGDEPTGQLVVDSYGNVLGTTSGGGANGDGTVFELPYDSANSTNHYDLELITLHSFAGGTDGESPNGGLIISGGNLFGTAIDGGQNGDGTIFELTASFSSSTNPTYTYTTLYAFTGCAVQATICDGDYPYAALVEDGSGNLFGTTTGGGANHDGTIFELKATGSNTYSPTVTPLYAFTSANDGNLPLTNLVLDGSGNIYGTMNQGGSNTSTFCTNTATTPDECGTFFELPYDSTNNANHYDLGLTTLHSFTGVNDGANPDYGLFIDGSGNIFGTTMAGGNSGCAGLSNPNLFAPLEGCGAVFELAAPSSTAPLTFDYTRLRIIEGTTPGFNLQTEFETSSGATFDPVKQPVTLVIGSGSNYSVTISIPAHSFQVLTNGSKAGAWVYSGVINNIAVSMQIVPVSDGTYQFKASASPVSLPTGLTSVDVSITVGNNTGSTTVTPPSY